MWGGALALAGVSVACGESNPQGPPAEPGTQPTASRSLAESLPIVFTSDRAMEGVSDLYVMSGDGSNVQRLTQAGGFQVPTWSPDGKSIAFREVIDGTRADVGVLSPDDGSPPVLLTSGENARTARMPLDWSVDGSRVAYASWPQLNEMFVWSVAKTGGEATRVLPNLACCQQSAVWSPDGSQLAYLTFDQTRTLDVWLVSESRGTEPVNLTQGRVYAPITPRWSPDGTHLALSGYAVDSNGKVEGLGGHRSGQTLAPDTEVFVLTLDTSELVRLTDNAAEDFAPSWSPDGEQLLIESDRDGDLDLWLLPVAAPEQARNLIDDSAAPRQDEAPSWYRPR